MVQEQGQRARQDHLEVLICKVDLEDLELDQEEVQLTVVEDLLEVEPLVLMLMDGQLEVREVMHQEDLLEVTMNKGDLLVQVARAMIVMVDQLATMGQVLTLVVDQSEVMVPILI
uniref:Uncharacterized protein n=1 Tax=Anopheles christyi TaxID=43041 RepID=A0A182JRY4_9DIPT